MPLLPTTIRLQRQRDADPWQRVLLWLLGITVFVTPIFFLPFGSEPFEWHKTLLFVFLVSVSVVVAFLRAVFLRTTFFTRTPVDLFLLAMLAAVALSTIFSVHPYESLVGVEGYHHETLVAVLAFALFFFLIVHVIRSARQVRTMLLLFLASMTLFALVEILQLYRVFVLPWDVTKATAFNLLANAFTVLGVMGALTCLLALGLSVIEQDRRFRIALKVLALLAFVVLILLDAPAGWYALFLGTLALLIALNRLPSPAPRSWLLVLIGLALLAVVFLFVPLSSVTRVAPSVDFLLDHASSARIVRETLAQRPLFGSGPETFNVDFAAYRPVAFNASSLWQYRFIKASNAVWQYLATLGILGVAALAALFVRGALVFRQALRRGNPKDGAWALLVFLLLGIGVILFGSLIFPKTFVLQFSFWLFAALAMRLALGDRTREQAGLAVRSWAPVGLLLSLGLTVTVGYFGGRFWVAEYWYGSANRDVRQAKDIQTVEGKFQNAIRLNPWDARYRFALAQNSIVRAQLLVASKEPDVATIRQLLAQAEDQALRGVALAPKQSDSYEALADLYGSTGGFVGLAAVADRQAQALQDAIARDPNNPSPYLQLGRAYLTYVASLRQSAAAEESEDAKKARAEREATFLTEARSAFTRAAERKADFPDARVGLALTAEAGGDQDGARRTLEGVIAEFPNDANLRFELGLLELRASKDEAAQVAFQAAILVAPDHANAHYQLSKLFEKNGELDQAIAELEAVLKTNPDNAQVQSELDALKQKKESTK